MSNTKNANYVYVVPNSHYWNTLESLIYWAGITGPIDEKKEQELIIGLKNTLKNGYELLKKSDHVPIADLKKVFKKYEDEAREQDDKNSGLTCSWAEGGASSRLALLREIQREIELLEL